MKKLLLTLVVVSVIASLHGMEPEKKLSSINLPQTYSHLAKELLPEIAQHIFSLQIKESGVNLAELSRTIIEQSYNGPYDLMTCIGELITSYGYMLSVELFKKYFPHEKISICDIKNRQDRTVLYGAAWSGRTETVKLLLNAIGDTVYTLLAMRDSDGQTAFDVANAEVKEVMKPYMQNNNQS